MCAAAVTFAPVLVLVAACALAQAQPPQTMNSNEWLAFQDLLGGALTRRSSDKS
jgi:hypothetical protein